MAKPVKPARHPIDVFRADQRLLSQPEMQRLVALIVGWPLLTHPTKVVLRLFEPEALADFCLSKELG
jgi:hypothetical protein